MRSAMFVSANESKGFVKVTVKVCAPKTRFEPTFFKNDFISNQLLSETHFWALFASKMRFFSGSSRFALLRSRSTIRCSKSAFRGTSGFFSSLNSVMSSEPSVKPVLIRSILALTVASSALSRSICVCLPWKPSALQRHVRGDWGNLDDEDKQANEDALHRGSRLLSSYQTSQNVKFWIITEADRSVTTVLLPEDY